MKRGALLHPKMRSLACLLKVPLPYAWGLIEGLVHFTSTYCPRGDVGRYTNSQIAEYLEWPKQRGGPDKLINAFLEAGWLDKCEKHGLLVHDWPEHADNATKKKLARNGESFAVRVCECPENVQTCPDIGETCPALARGRKPVPVPVPVPEPEPEPEPDEADLASAFPEMDMDGSLPDEIDDEPLQPEEPAILTFPCAGDTKEWHLTQSQVDQWRALFPTIDILAECRHALAWVDANIGRKKTASGMKRFLVRWIGESQNKGRGRTESISQPKMPVCKRDIGRIIGPHEEEDYADLPF